MNILLVSPLGFPVNSETKYAGIEVLVYNYASELIKNHQVTVIGHVLSKFPAGVTLLGDYPKEQGQYIYLDAEVEAYKKYGHLARSFDVIMDFSHSHLICKVSPNLPALNLFWHAPNEAQYPKAPYNIIGLSNWACRMFKQYYHQEAKYQQSIALDTEVYKINHHLHTHRTDRFLTLGRMAKEKGNLKAVEMCLKAGVKLDVCGADSDAGYKEAILKLCDGKQIRYLGEVSNEKKIQLMQSCKGLIYATEYPEVTNHKVNECMLCGAPVIAPAIGALPEIIFNGTNGYLYFNDNELLKAIKTVDELPIIKSYSQFAYNQFAETYSIRKVVNDYIPLFEKVAKGLRW